MTAATAGSIGQTAATVAADISGLVQLTKEQVNNARP